MTTIDAHHDSFERHGLFPILGRGNCWVCGASAPYVDVYFEAPVCGAICSWASWEALRLHDTPWRAW